MNSAFPEHAFERQESGEIAGCERPGRVCGRHQRTQAKVQQDRSASIGIDNHIAGDERSMREPSCVSILERAEERAQERNRLMTIEASRADAIENRNAAAELGEDQRAAVRVEARCQWPRAAGLSPGLELSLKLSEPLKESRGGGPPPDLQPEKLRRMIGLHQKDAGRRCFTERQMNRQSIRAGVPIL